MRLKPGEHSHRSPQRHFGGPGYEQHQQDDRVAELHVRLVCGSVRGCSWTRWCEDTDARTAQFREAADCDYFWSQGVGKRDSRWRAGRGSAGKADAIWLQSTADADAAFVVFQFELHDAAFATAASALHRRRCQAWPPPGRRRLAVLIRWRRGASRQLMSRACLVRVLSLALRRHC